MKLVSQIPCFSLGSTALDMVEGIAPDTEGFDSFLKDYQPAISEGFIWVVRRFQCSARKALRVLNQTAILDAVTGFQTTYQRIRLAQGSIP